MADLGRILEDKPVNPGYCLVLRPMGGEYDRVWGEISRALEATFAWTDVGTLRGAGTIMEEVLREIGRTDAVIVDVSEARPNVFYELGIAHATKGDRKVVLVKQASSHVPSTCRRTDTWTTRQRRTGWPHCCRNSSHLITSPENEQQTRSTSPAPRLVARSALVESNAGASGRPQAHRFVTECLAVTKLGVP